MSALGGIKDAALLLVKAGSRSDFLDAAGHAGAQILGVEAVSERCC